MDTESKPAEPSLSDEMWETIDAAVDRLEQCWTSGAEVDLSQIAPPADSPIHETLLAELVKVDLEHRWKAGREKRVEDYLREWPELNARPELVRDLLEAECLTRTLFTSAEPTRGEIDARFPGVAEKIRWDFIEGELENRRYRQSILREGELFGRDQRYEIRALLGQGGMGAVYRAFDRRLDREVALKIPLLDPQLKQAVLDRFLREAKAAAKIRHPNVCPIYDADRVGETYYLTMALIEGRPLSRWMASRTASAQEAAAIAAKLARALAAVHAEGFLHRDIKPANVVIDEKGEPWLMDFGLAGQAIEEFSAMPPQHAGAGAPDSLSIVGSQLTQSKTLLGTVPYMAPELFQGKKAGPQSDIYSLGVLLYEMLAGRHPFLDEATGQFSLQSLQSEPTPMRTLRPEADEELEAICLKALAKNPAERFASAEEMAEELETAAQPAPPPKKRRGLWLLSAFFLPAAFLAGVIFYFKTGEGSVRFEVNVPDAAVTVDEKAVRIEAGKAEIVLPVGEHRLEVSREGFHPHGESFALNWRGGRAEIKIELKSKYIARWIKSSNRISQGVFNRQESRLYLAATLYPQPSMVQAIEMPSGKLLQNIVGATGDNDYKSIAISPDDRYLFVTNYFLKSLTRIDLKAKNAKKDLDIGGRWDSTLGISPNRKLLVVGTGVDGRVKDEKNDRLAVVNIDNGRFELLGTAELDDELHCLQFGFSADSRFAYFVTRPRKSAAFALYEVALEKPYRVTRKLEIPNARLEGIAVSAKANRIFLGDSRNRQVAVVDLESFTQSASYKVAGDAPGPLALNAAENLLAAACPDAKKIYFLDPEDGAILEEAAGFGDALSDMKFSADEKRLYAFHYPTENAVAVVDLEPLLERCRIVFSSNRDGGSHQLYLVGAEGKNPKRLTASKGTDIALRWSPDGRKIAFVSDRDGPPKIHLIKRNGEPIKILGNTDPLDLTSRNSTEAPLAWSPDGRRIAFIANGYRAIRAVDVKSGEVENLFEGDVEGGYAQHTSLCWDSSDGSLLFASQNSATSESSAITRLDVKTGKVRTIYRSDGSTFRFMTPAISRDGKKIAAARDYFQPAPSTPLTLLDADGGKPQLLSGTAGMNNFSPRWTAGGNALVYVGQKGKRNHIFLLRLPNGKPAQLTDGDWDDINPDVWGE
ncbi:MAG: protein kinase [Pirellulales bacterium]|nr:protein kinase [Pirellulales bacterium]